MEFSEYKNTFDRKPCDDAIEWLFSQPDLKTAWKECKRGDWMWWSLMYSGTDLPQSLCVGFANDCAERAKDYANKSKSVYADSAADAAYAAAYAAYAAASYAASAADSAADAAAADAASADSAAAEKELQANWIRAHVECPF